MSTENPSHLTVVEDTIPPRLFIGTVLASLEYMLSDDESIVEFNNILPSVLNKLIRSRNLDRTLNYLTFKPASYMDIDWFDIEKFEIDINLVYAAIDTIELICDRPGIADIDTYGLDSLMLFISKFCEQNSDTIILRSRPVPPQPPSPIKPLLA